MLAAVPALRSATIGTKLSCDYGKVAAWGDDVNAARQRLLPGAHRVEITKQPLDLLRHCCMVGVDFEDADAVLGSQLHVVAPERGLDSSMIRYH